MTRDQIIDSCNDILPAYQSANATTKFEVKGVLTSEMLIVCALAEYFKVSTIVESGRARGFSTELMTNFHRNEFRKKIISVELERYTKDAYISEKKFKETSNVELVYGDAFKLLPDLTNNDECVVVIDGPKGRDAVLLAAKILVNKTVKAVFIHDLHSTAYGRDMLESLFSNIFFTDDSEYVEAFKWMDEHCWDAMKATSELGDGWAPYLRKGIHNDSYGNTFAVIFNDQEGLDLRNEAILFMEQQKMELGKALRLREGIRRRILFFKNLIQRSFWYLKFSMLK